MAILTPTPDLPRNLGFPRLTILAALYGYLAAAIHRLKVGLMNSP